MAIYLQYSADELERQYDVTIGAGDVDAVQDRYRRASDAVVASGLGELDIAYGDDPLQRLDLFPAAGGSSPIFVFVHGGYWKGGGKIGRRFPAALHNAAGIAWVPIDYRLTPDVTMDEIVSDVRAALAWVWRNAATFGGDPDRIFVAGSSAGGHLTGMLLAPGWHAEYGLPADVVKGACPMSGIYDLEPLRHISHQENLKLDDGVIARNSPIGLPPAKPIPVVVAWGARESDEFARQSQSYAQMLRKVGCAVTEMPVAEHDHFTVMGEMGRSEAALAQAMLRLVQGET